MKFKTILLLPILTSACVSNTAWVVNKKEGQGSINVPKVVAKLKQRGWKIEEASSSHIETKWRTLIFDKDSQFHATEILSRIRIDQKNGQNPVATGDCMYRKINGPFFFRKCEGLKAVLVKGSVESILQ